MKKTMLFSLCAATALLFSSSFAKATTLANWTFESFTTGMTSTGVSPASPFAVPITPESGTGSATALHASSATVWSDPAGNPPAPSTTSLFSLSSNHWAVGDYYQFSVPGDGSLGYSIQFDQIGSGTGPANFTIQYSTDGSTFNDISTYTLPSGVSWNTSTYISNTTFSGVTPPLGSAPSTVYFRLTDNSTTSIGGGTVATAGTGRVDNVIITDVPEPTALTLIGLGLVGLVGATRLRKKI